MTFNCPHEVRSYAHSRPTVSSKYLLALGSNGSSSVCPDPDPQSISSMEDARMSPNLNPGSGTPGKPAHIPRMNDLRCI